MLSVDSYNRLITGHGLGMIFLFIMPLLISFLGNWQLPQSYMALDFIVPRLNLLSFYFLFTSCLLVLLSISREEGVAAGWTLYVPLSDGSFHSSSAMSLMIIAIHVLGLSSEGGSITFLCSLFGVRSSGLLTFLYCLVT